MPAGGRNLPSRDLGAIDAGFLNRHIELALLARGAHDWTAKVPFDIFMNDALPYASLSEQREIWRGFMFQELSPVVDDCKSTIEAADIIN
ncbi:hypothetical protein WJX73_007763 [Symbiochloris irregularis]|uniref:Uncharacterized protein n=1 Tax=Symbiochloris irregularis TaxID=706552 RepID=A0AAW1PM41_9CHLO